MSKVRGLQPAFFAFGAGVVLLFASYALAEQPTWSALTRPAYVILRHDNMAFLEQNDEGIWAFDVDFRAYRRVRPFFFNTGGAPVGFYHGEGSYLTPLGDRLLFESFPANIEFDLATMRAVRRYTPLEGLASWGGLVQGPVVDAQQASSIGLEPGGYGLVGCFPGYGYFPCPWGADLGTWNSIWRRGLEPDDGTAESILDLRPLFPSWRRLGTGNFFTLDEGRRGFWLAWDGTPWFLPVRDGAIDLAGATEHPLGIPLESLLWHPSAGRFLARRNLDTSTSIGTQFVALDEDLGITDVFGTWGPQATDPKERVPWTFAAFPPDPPTGDVVQTIPVVAHTPGRNGSVWLSDLWLYNPSGEATSVRIRRVAAPAAPARVVDLPAHGSAHIADALVWAGGGPDGDGFVHDALQLTSLYRWGAQVAASSRISTPSSDPDEAARGGTMGHAVPAVPGEVGYSNHLLQTTIPTMEIANPALLVLDDQPGRFRHNLGVVNTGGEPLTLTLRWGMDWADPEVRVWPPPENTRTVTAPPHSVRLFNLEEVFPESIRSVWPAKIEVAGERPAIVWLSMVDNLTNDATFVPYTLFSLDGDQFTTAAFPAVADLPGEHGTYWRTDVHYDWYGFTGGPVAFYPAWPIGDSATAECPARTRTQQGDWLPAVVRDIVRIHVPEGNIRGGLELHVGSWMNAFARTYTTRADGGTYGEMLPLYPPRGWPVQHFAGIEVSPGFRVNLGLYNGDEAHAITHRLTLYAADGTQVATHDVVLAPTASLVERLERLLGLAVGSLPDGTYGLTVLPLDDLAHGVEGRSWAFVSIVDNVTGDPTNWW